LQAFPHALKSGTIAENTIVEILGNGGVTGYGEGAPRPYVTGETQESSIESIKLFLAHPHFPWDLEDISQVWEFVDSVPEGRERNAALCAVEMSLLDALGKKEGKPIIEYFPLGHFTEKIFYGAAMPLGGRDQILEIAEFIKGLGITRIKLKMDRDFKKNSEMLKVIVDVFERGCDLKIDVNGAWDLGLSLSHIPLIEEYNIRVVEQPMVPGDQGLSDFSNILKELNVKLMADESACTLEDVKDLVAEGHYDMINVRLSKCGGFRRSLRIIEYLREQGIVFQIACQLGESGLLSAAGRALSLLCRDSLYYDGSYDRFLLRENITLEDVSFGPGGEAGPLGGSGLGIGVSNENLRKLSHYSETFPNPCQK